MKDLPSFNAKYRSHFNKVYVRKPKASRDRSREVYLVGKGFTGVSPVDDTKSVEMPSGSGLAPRGGNSG